MKHRDEETAERLITIGIFSLMFGIIAVMAWFQAGCDYGLDVNVGIKLDDKCLFELPDCDAGSYSCGHYEGTRWVDVGECRVACAAGRALMCTASGPECTQTVGDEMPAVPVLCAARDGGT